MNFCRLQNPGAGWGPLSLTRSGLRRFEAALQYFFARRASSNNRNIKSKKSPCAPRNVWASTFWCYLPGSRDWAPQFVRVPSGQRLAQTKTPEEAGQPAEEKHSSKEKSSFKHRRLRSIQKTKIGLCSTFVFLLHGTAAFRLRSLLRPAGHSQKPLALLPQKRLRRLCHEDVAN